MADPQAAKSPIDLEPRGPPHSRAAGISVCGFLPLARQTNLADRCRLALLMAALGIVIRALASGQVKKDRELTTTGPYAYVRNPLYLGSIIIGDRIRRRRSRPLGRRLADPAMFVLIYVPVIRGEETSCAANFRAYADYTRRVPSLLPRTLLFRQNDGRLLA